MKRLPIIIALLPAIASADTELGIHLINYKSDTDCKACAFKVADNNGTGPLFTAGYFLSGPVDVGVTVGLSQDPYAILEARKAFGPVLVRFGGGTIQQSADGFMPGALGKDGNYSRGTVISAGLDIAFGTNTSLSIKAMRSKADHDFRFISFVQPYYVYDSGSAEVVKNSISVGFSSSF